MGRWLLGLPSIGNQPGDEIDNEVGRAPMTGWFNLWVILELVNDGPDDEALTRGQFVLENNESILQLLRMGVINCGPRARRCSERAWER